MKAQYENKPQPVEYIGQGTWYINENITEITEGESSHWECDQRTVYEDPAVADQAEVTRQLQSIMQTQLTQMTDEQAQNYPALFPSWKDKIGMPVAVGERYYYNKKLFKVIQAHTCQSDWNPEATPALFTQVYVEEWPNWVQPTGAQDAYNAGDKVTYQGQHYVSLINGNVWSPSDYPAGWEVRQ